MAVLVLLMKRSISCSSLPVLTLFTKQGECSLCDEAKTVLSRYKNLFAYEEILIDRPENLEWRKLYRYDIPVVHINGKYIMKHKVDEKKLVNALQN